MIPFSPYDPNTRKLYLAIKVAFRKTVVISDLEASQGYILEAGTPYVLQLGTLAKESLAVSGVFAGPISFQQHEGANYAVTQ